ncbi:MAG TPA: glycosyltransferase family 1 protein [Candidatus Eisenbacteria bacterium]
MTRPVLYTGDIFRLQARGGITRYFTELIPRLSRPARLVAGLHQSPAIRGGRLPAEAARYMPGFRLSPRPRAVFNAWIDSVRIVRTSGVILHPTYYRDPARLPSAPLVLTVYDMAHERFPSLFRRGWWNSEDPARWKRAIVSRADRVVCISESTQRDLVEFLNVDERKTHVIHCGSTDWDAMPAEEVPGMKPPFFLWVGERHTYKNFAETLRAWASSSAKASTSILCVGGGPLRREERESAEALGVAGSVRQRTLRDAQLKWAYERAAGLLYTSRCEGFGLPLVEAMSLGCPVVASNTSSMPEVAGDVAIYVEPTDRESLRVGIERCLAVGRDGVLGERLKARAARFSWDACAAAHEALYREFD